MQEILRPQLHIAVCDDEACDRQQIAGLVNETMLEEGLSCRITSFESGTGLLSAIQNGAQFQILLLDVMMDGLDGMELASALREKGDYTAIIFISSNREMAMRGYEVEALRYLAKPVDRARLREALMFCCRTRLEQKEILLPTASGQRRILLSDLIYAETWERGVRLILKDGQTETGMKISELAAMLPERQFVFCHRTILVNLAFIQSIRYCELELKSGAALPVSKYRQSEIRKQLMRYLEG
ncbi:MAG: LytTR family DNA-binding domain-containing protein [Clostridiales bacterium]|nr:LytTR family DNA-binding domain-containing protein [Clostridiales bacterium]